MDLRKLTLRDLRADEYFVEVVRHHWWVLLRSIFGILLIFLIPFILLPLMGFYFAQAGINAAQIGAMSGFIAAVWALLCWQLLFVRWTDYYYDVWIITNWRIVDIDQQGLFRRNTASILDLNHIQDIDTELNGIVGNILNFGSIMVQTAGAKNEFSFEDVSNPTRVEGLIREAQAKLTQLHAREMHEAAMGPVPPPPTDGI